MSNLRQYFDNVSSLNNGNINRDFYDISEYCRINNIDDIDIFLYDCMIKGYHIEKYGLLTNTENIEIIEKIVEKEVIVEKPVEKIIEKEVIVEKPVEKIIEKEVIVERPVHKIINIEYDNELNDFKLKYDQISNTLDIKNNELEEKNKIINELTKKVKDLNQIIENNIIKFHSSSNLKK